MKVPTVWTLVKLHLHVVNGPRIGEKGSHHYYSARPMGNGSIFNRIRCAYLVFAGKADAVVWPGGQ